MISTQALSLDEGPAEPWAVVNNLGVAYERLGRLDHAVRAYREAARLHPRYALPRENLRRARAAAAARGDADAAPAAPARAAEPAGDDVAPGPFDELFFGCACLCAPAASPDRCPSKAPPTLCCAGGGAPPAAPS